ncbi:RNA polymerase sigma factor [Parasphingorhabdus cellanae]|uniref:RNA polymerase sigma factor n=1 Tax=Parasphingorhabdus cellanae TaxID=2806553 RepID=A0ABX7TA17_9SPHN|nr:RNA polymerase sigma factor [Parasphingorhabdus cellanae]QTD57482.1 RNA polymerase sigma factor [Parasphingorhabdus cellanae]
MDQSHKKADASALPVDPDQLAKFARLYDTALTRYFAKRGCQDATVQDLVQEVFIRLAKRSVERVIENPEAYLMQTASSVWNDHLRYRQRRNHNDHIEYDEEMHAGEAFSPARVLEGKQEIERLMEALQQLPPRTRQAYLLCRVEGMKRKTAAERMGISVSGIEKHLMKATLYIARLFGDPK